MKAPVVFWVLAAASAIILGSAWYAQYILDMAPCGLCLRQRIGHYVLIPGGVLAAILWHYVPYQRRFIHLVGLVVLALAAGFSLYWAGFHIGVENKWWEGLATCGGAASANLSIEQLLNTPFVPCDQPTIIFKWLFGGLSMATVHFILLLPLLHLAVWSLSKAVVKLTGKKEGRNV